MALVKENDGPKCHALYSFFERVLALPKKLHQLLHRKRYTNKMNDEITPKHKGLMERMQLAGCCSLSFSFLSVSAVVLYCVVCAEKYVCIFVCVHVYVDDNI